MSYRDQLVSEINTQLDRLMKVKQPWRAQWIAHSVCTAHAEGLTDCEHADFWRYSSYEFTRKLVTECINRRAGPKADRVSEKEQFAFPGFAREHLQNYYVVTREGEDVGIFVGEMTDAEIDAKINLYRAQAVTCKGHADELERFKEWRTVRKTKEFAAA